MRVLFRSNLFMNTLIALDDSQKNKISGLTELTLAEVEETSGGFAGAALVLAGIVIGMMIGGKTSGCRKEA
jgi:hypothetical protein